MQMMEFIIEFLSDTSEISEISEKLKRRNGTGNGMSV